MSDEPINSIAVKILGQEYKIKCPPDKMSELQAAAVYLDKMMQEIRDGSKILSADRIAVIAALNIAHEMLILKKQKQQHIDSLSRQIQDIQYKVEEVLMKENALNE